MQEGEPVRKKNNLGGFTDHLHQYCVDLSYPLAETPSDAMELKCYTNCTTVQRRSLQKLIMYKTK